MEESGISRKIFNLIVDGKIGFVLMLFMGLFFLLLPGGPFLSVEADWVAGSTANSDMLSFGKVQSVIFHKLFALAGSVAGERGEFFFRVLNIPAALIALIGCSLLGRKFGGKSCGIYSAWLMVGAYGFLFWGRLASEAMIICALGVWGSLLLLPWENVTGRRRFIKIFLASVILLAGVIIGDTAVFIVLLLFLVIRKAVRRQKLGFDLSFCAAFLLALFSVFCLIMVIAWRREQSFFSTATVLNALQFIYSSLLNTWDRLPFMFRDYPWYRGIRIMLEMFLPWPLFLFSSIYFSLRHWRKCPTELRDLLILTVMMALLLAAVPGRNLADNLVVLPFFAVLSGAGLTGETVPVMWRKRIEMVMHYLFIVFASLAVTLPVTLPLWDILLKIEPPMELMIITPVFGLAALLIMTFMPLVSGQFRRIFGMRMFLGSTLIAGVLLSAVVICLGFRASQRFRTDYRFWRSCGKILEQSGNEVLVFYKVTPDSTTDYYLRTKQMLRFAGNISELSAVLKECAGHKVCIICESSPLAGETLKSVNPSQPATLLLTEADDPGLLMPGIKRNSRGKLAMWCWEE